MWHRPLFPPNRRSETPPNRCVKQHGRPVTVRVLSVLIVLALVIAGLNAGPRARAQAPGPELFAQEPKTPLELWSAIDYLVRTGQSKKAVPYLEKFTNSQVDDATLVEIRDRYGPGSILRLADDPATGKFAQPLAERLTEAVRRFAVEPERIRRAVAELMGTKEEQAYADAHLREAGPYAVAFLIERSSARSSRRSNDPSSSRTWVGSIAPRFPPCWPSWTVPIRNSPPPPRRHWEPLATPASLPDLPGVCRSSSACRS